MDLIHTEVTISIGFFILLLGMSLFGLFMAGVALAVAFANLWHRDQMFKELKRYNAMVSKDNPQMGGYFERRDSPIVGVGYGPNDTVPEFLEDRD